MTFKKQRCVLKFTFSSSNPSSHKTSELTHRIRDAEKQVRRFVAEGSTTSSEGSHSPHSHRRQSADAEGQQHYTHAADGGSDDDDSDGEDHYEESLDALEDRFHGLEEEVANLVADVHDLALYTKLNITGFMKILKVGNVLPVKLYL
jgi:hypothetical protein